MLTAERHALLLNRLRADGKIVAKEFAVELGVSEDSVRRDLRELAAAGLCQRVYGGALPASPAVADLATRQGIHSTGKQRVAALAASLIRAGTTVIVDGGTTAQALARHLPRDLEATIVTHSPTVASLLLDHARLEVFLIGGRLFKHSGVTCGAAAVESAQSINADLFFMGVTGVHPDAGLTTGDGDEAAMKRALAQRAADTYVLASAEKLGAASPFAVLPLADVAGIITDAPADSPDLTALTELGISVVAGPAPGSSRRTRG